MTQLAPHADQAVRHAVDAYIDGRLLPAFEGDATFETRNSRYRMVDGVLFSASDDSLLGAELVGWLVEYVSRAEITAAWRSGARAVLVDTRNDGIKGPHIVVTSATRHFRVARPSAPALRAPSSHPVLPHAAGSRASLGGSAMDHSWDRRSDNPFPPAVLPSAGWSHRADEHAQVMLPPATLPPPPALPRHLPFGSDPPFASKLPFAPEHAAVAHAHQSPAAHGLPRPPHVPPLTMPRLRASTFPPPPMPAGLVPTPRFAPGRLPAPAPLPWRQAPLPMKPATMPPPPPPRLLPRAAAPHPPAYVHSPRDAAAVQRITAAIEATFGVADETEDSAPTVRHEPRSSARASAARSSSRLAQGSSSGSRGMPMSSRLGPLPPASVPFMLSRSHQRGLPLR